MNESIRDLREFSQFGLNEKIQWPSDDELLDRINITSCEAVARELGVHGTALRGRLKRRGLYQLVNKRHGAILPGENNPSAKLKSEDVLQIRNEIQNGKSRKEIAQERNCSLSLIDKIATKEVWKHI